MAKEKKTENEGLLENFSLDDGVDFFGINAKEDDDTPANLVTKVIGATINDVDDDDDDSSTNIEGVKPTEEKEIEVTPKKVELPKKIVETTTKPKKAEEEKEDEDKKEKVDDSDFFNIRGDKKEAAKEKAEKKVDKGEEDEEVEDNDEEKEKEYFTTLATDLKEKGILSNVEIPKEGITEDQFFAMHDDEIEKRVVDTFEAIFEEIGQDGSNFLKFVKDGGNPRTFLTQISTQFNLEELDVENDNQVNRVLKHYLTTVEKLDEDDLTDRLAWLKEGGKSKSYATKYFKAIKDKDKEGEELLLETQKRIAKEKENSAKEFNSSLKEVISKIDNVGSFSIDKSEHKELNDYITKPIVKAGKNIYIPAFQDKLAKILRGKTDSDKQKLVILAKIFKDDFKLPELEEKAETKVISKAKSKLARRINTVSHTSSGGLNKVSLADVVD